MCVVTRGTAYAPAIKVARLLPVPFCVLRVAGQAGSEVRRSPKAEEVWIVVAVERRSRIRS